MFTGKDELRLGQGLGSGLVWLYKRWKMKMNGSHCQVLTEIGFDF